MNDDTIIVYWDKYTNHYFLQNVHNRLVINGKEIGPRSGILDLGEFPPTSIVRIDTTTDCYYINSKTGEKLSRKKFKDLKQRLFGEHLDEHGGLNSDDEQVIIEWAVFKSRWDSDYESRQTECKLNILIKECPFSEYPEITPIHQLEPKSINSAVCILQFDPSRNLSELIEEEGYKLNLERGRHSGIEFFKVDGEYIFSSRNGHKKTVNGFEARLTYEECIKTKNEHKAIIKKLIDIHLASKSTKSLCNIGSVVSKLKSISLSLKTVESKQKTYNDYQYCRRKVTELIKELTEESKE